MTERVVILDAGAQYGKVIDRRVRELSVECDLLPLDTPPDQLTQYAAMIISGGPQSVYDADAPRYDPAIFSLGVPVLGICYGMQLLCCAHGGSVARKARREDGQFEVEVEADCALFEGVSSRTPVLLTHGDSLNELPAVGALLRARATSSRPSNSPSASTTACTTPRSTSRRRGRTCCATSCIAGAASRDRTRWLRAKSSRSSADLPLALPGRGGLRPHPPPPPSTPTTVCLARRYIRSRVGEKRVLCLVSGGVDSSVCAALLHKAIGRERVIALHVDHGFMREQESATVAAALRRRCPAEASATVASPLRRLKWVGARRPRSPKRPPRRRSGRSSGTLSCVSPKRCARKRVRARDATRAHTRQR